jgi:hypothetical protein
MEKFVRSGSLRVFASLIVLVSLISLDEESALFRYSGVPDFNWTKTKFYYRSGLKSNCRDRCSICISSHWCRRHFRLHQHYYDFWR